jgi:hypothetical protein
MQRLTTLIYLFIYGLFNDAVSSSDYAASNKRMISEYLIRTDIEGNGQRPV